MKTVKMALMDNDAVIQCKTDVCLNKTDNKDFIRFIRQIREELVIGQSATLEIIDPPEDAITLTVSYAE